MFKLENYQNNDFAVYPEDIATLGSLKLSGDVAKQNPF
jgi:hypothetical protein